MAPGQWLLSPEGTRWHFDAGALSLDYAYTGDFELGHPEWERLHRPQDLDRWMEDHLPFKVAPVSDADFGRARQLRTAIAHATRRLAAGGEVSVKDIAALNETAAHPDFPPRLEGGVAGPPASVEQALSVIARQFITGVAARRDRLKVCAAEDCGLIFLDTSKPGSRRWCSMQRCGNRAKIRHYRTKSATRQRGAPNAHYSSGA